jgi:putative hemolysin
MTVILIEIGLLVVLLLANGVFAMAEIAIVSSRKARLKVLADEGHAGATAALGLVEQPGLFLSTVQVGITLVGTLAGASSGATMISQLTPLLESASLPHNWALTLSTLLVVAFITYLSVVIGELVPKRLAIHAPERSAARLSRPMLALSRLASPVVRLLDSSSAFIARLLGVRGAGESTVSEDEVRALIQQGTLAGVFKQSEQRMFEGLLNLDDLVASDLMTPKNRIVWLDLNAPDEENWRKLAESGHSYFPAYRGVRDNVLGLMSVKSLWAAAALKQNTALDALLTPPIFVPETTPCPRVIEQFRKHGRYLAIVVDEFGGVSGLITLHDMMESIVGSLPELGRRSRPSALQQPDGSWMADALMPMEEVATLVGLKLPDDEDEEGNYRTLAGFVLRRLGHLPSEGETFAFGGYQFRIVDMDHQRIDKVSITADPAAATA